MENKDKKLLSDELNAELQNVSDWLVSSKLSLNVNKSNFLFFSNRKDKEPPKWKSKGQS